MPTVYQEGVLHFNSEEEVNESLKNWPEGAFGTGSNPHKPKSLGNSSHCAGKTGYLKNVDTSITKEFIENLFSSECKVEQVTSQHNRNTGRPMPVVKIEFSSAEDLNTAKTINTFLQYNGKPAFLEAETPLKVIRCYNCHTFGQLEKLVPILQSLETAEAKTTQT